MRIQRPETWVSPFSRLTTLRDEINRLFEAPYDELARATELFTEWSPAVDVYENKDNLIVKAELPGMKKEEIQLSLHEDMLTISGERTSDHTEEEHGTSRSERYFGRFQRTVTLPKAVDAKNVSARYKNGILTVSLPKAEEAKPRQIEVKVN